MLGLQLNGIVNLDEIVSETTYLTVCRRLDVASPGTEARTLNFLLQRAIIVGREVAREALMH